MKRRVMILICLLLAALSCTAWAVGAEETACHSQAELFQCGSLEAQDVVPGELGLLDAEQSLVGVLVDGMKTKSDAIDVSAFNLIVDELKNEKGETIAWVGADADKLKDAYAQAVNSHPELVYVLSRYKMSGVYTYDRRIKITAVSPQYDSYFTDEVMVQFEQAVAEARALVAEEGLTDLEKALILHDYLVTQVTYNWEVDIALKTGESMERVELRTGTRIYTAYGALVEGDAVCQGYALAYKLLLDQCGVNSVLVSSDAMNHAWNLVEIDGDWYHVDATWDDPVPDLPGYCGHKNFLRSDAGITGTKHYGWTTPDGITVSSTEPEGLFRGTNNRMYYYEESYYYLSIVGGRGSLYRADSLTDPEPETVQNNMSFFRHQFLDPEDGLYYSYPMYGVVWHEGALYYVDSDKKMTCYSLTDGSSATLGDVPFEAADSADRMYDSTQDAIGLYYDSQTGEIVAVSKTRPDTVLARFQIKEYPVSWDQLPKNETALAGGVQKDDAVLQVGLVWAEQGETANLLAAFYQDGRLVKVQMVSSDDWTPGLNVLTIDLEGYPDYDRVTLFLLSDGSVPYCEKKTP